MSVYCSNRHCKKRFSRAPRQCPNCGCIEFVGNIALATGGYDEATERRLMAHWRSGRANQSQLPGRGRVYHSQAEIDEDKLR